MIIPENGTTISIIIPMYGKWQYVHSRLWELYNNCISYVNRMEVIILDDASGEEGLESKARWWKSSGTFPNLRFEINEVNLGFGGNCNKGLDLATGDVQIIHTTDVKVMSDHLRDTLNILRDPMKFVGGRLLDFDTGWNVFDDKMYTYLEGWWLAGTKEFWSKHRFDLVYGKYDYEDMDLSQQAIKSGYELIEHPNSNRVFHHFSGLTINSVDGIEKRREHTEKNKKLFQEKWCVKS